VSVAGFSLFSSLGEGFERTPKGIFTSLFFIPQAHDPIVRSGWSLNYEVLFYVLFGTAIWLGRTRAKAALVLWAMIIAAGFVLPSTLIFDFYLNPLQYEFILGVLAAVMYLRRPSGEKAGAAFFFSGLILFAAGTHDADFMVSHFGRLYAVMGAGLPSAMIIYGSACFDQRVLWPKALIAIGDASYSIYLSHSLFLSAGARIYDLNTNTAVIADVGFSIAAGFASYLLTEKPLLKLLKERLPHRRPVLVPDPALLRS
jgi:exopolysaccharide production protein ExoZ